jgi:hypothetical protein
MRKLLVGKLKGRYHLGVIDRWGIIVIKVGLKDAQAYVGVAWIRLVRVQ